jgi:hypothetical protein
MTPNIRVVTITQHHNCKSNPNPCGGGYSRGRHNGKMWWRWQGYGGVEYDGDDKVQDKTQSRT